MGFTLVLQSSIILNFEVNMMAVLIILLLNSFMNIIWLACIHTKYIFLLVLIPINCSSNH